jgi:hypothetical protein
LQFVNSPHLLEHFILSIILTLEPFIPQNLAIRNGLAERDRVNKAVFEYSRVGAHARDIVCVVVLAEITKFIGNIEVVELISD